MTNDKVTIVMYHYVRDLRNSKYPKIKGLELDLFIEQINYFEKKFVFITMEELIDSIYNHSKLPKNALLLTFDDAYIDHYSNVFPILMRKNIQGSFFVPVKAIENNEVLDVNKIHFILASSININDLIKRTFQELENQRKIHNLQSNEYYFNKLAIASRMDSKEVIFFKRLLQKELPESIRSSIIDQLFKEFVRTDEDIFSRELYMNKEQLSMMVKNGMHIGHHGYNHKWLNSVSKEEQQTEIENGCKFLKNIGVDMNNWTMCYPYGAYDHNLINIIKSNNCKLALTTHVDVANISKHNQYELPRLDTNDFPINGT